ncbi:MAG: DUF4294 domain-containing protein [Chitinophagaceae bacterium]|nr:DUF4294 domain-containing protein [Chitinophagaceae bacterium]
MKWEFTIRFVILLVVCCALNIMTGKAQARYGIHDTLIVPAVIYNGDTIPAQVLAGVYVWQRGKVSARWTRLRNAVYVTYPYAYKAGIVFNDIERHITNLQDKKQVSKYINSREKELKKEFADPLKNLSIYQGKILMKLINRETGGTNCYDIIKELKGGFTARFWQTVAFVFGSSLKQPYDAYGQDADIEVIVQEVRRMYGYPS